MAKGLAVVSGSNDVVFKALETGVITLGSVVTDAEVTLTGSLTINKHADGGHPLIITGLSSSTNSDAADRILVIDAGGVVKAAQRLDSDDVYFTGSAETLTEFSASVYTAISNVAAGTTLNISASNGTGDIPLSTGKLVLESADSNLEVTITDNGSDVKATFNVADNLSVVTLTASSGLLVESGGASITGDISGSGTLQIGSTSTLGGTVTVTTGDVFASSGEISASANLSAGGNLAIAGSGNITGDLTVVGDLLVQGSVTTIDTQNLTVADAIILVGSGSDASAADLGFVFGTEENNNRGFSVEGGEFYLGTTSADASSVNINVTDNGILHLGALSASAGVNALQVEVGAGGLTVAGDTTLNGAVTLGDASTDAITINGFITGSGSPIVVSSSLTIGDGTLTGDSLETTTFVSQVRMPIFSVSGANAVAGFPTVPPDYAANPSSYNGYMFYLTSSSGFPNWNGDNDWSEGNKWYFNERGEWHESFFFNSNNFN